MYVSINDCAAPRLLAWMKYHLSPVCFDLWQGHLSENCKGQKNVVFSQHICLN